MGKSKTVGIVLAVIFGGGILLLLLCGGLLYMGYRNADQNVSPLIDELFASIDNGTYVDTYDTMTTADFRAATSRENYEQIGQAIANTMGSLKSKTLTSFNVRKNNADSFIDVGYNATFANGDGTIEAELQHVDEAWKFLSFTVNSPLFQQQAEGSLDDKAAAEKSLEEEADDGMVVEEAETEE